MYNVTLTLACLFLNTNNCRRIEVDHWSRPLSFQLRPASSQDDAVYQPPNTLTTMIFCRRAKNHSKISRLKRAGRARGNSVRLGVGPLAGLVTGFSRTESLHHVVLILRP